LPAGRGKVSYEEELKEDQRMQQSVENQEVKAPVPPFNEETARQKVKAAEDAWNKIGRAHV
jgi:hypothetical protein